MRKIAFGLAVSLMLLVGAAMVASVQGQTSARSLGNDEFTADVKPSRTVILSPQLPGHLKKVLVEVDEFVEEGQVLAVLDDTLQQIVVEAARLRAIREDEIRLAEAAVGEAELELERARDLVAKKAAQEYEVRKRELELKKAQTQLSAAKHEKQVAEIQLRLEMERLERHQIRAPFAGRILEVAAEPGATLSERDPVLTLIAVDELDARFILLPKELHNQLEVGREYRLQALEPVNQELVGRLKWISPQIDYGSGSIRAEFTIDNRELKLKPGFGVRLIWPQDTRAAGR